MALKTIKEIYAQNKSSFVDNILSYDVSINELIEGSDFGIQFFSGKPTFYNKKNEISEVDRCINNFYEEAINHFLAFPIDYTISLPYNFRFFFKYQPLTTPLLRITHILNISTGQVIVDEDTLKQWADYFKTGHPPILFAGKLDDTQKAAVLDFAYASQDELTAKFKTISFTAFILNLLGKPLEYSNQLNGIVFRFSNGEETFTAKQIDPQFYEDATTNQPTNPIRDNATFSTGLISMIVSHINRYSIDDLKAVTDKHLTFDENYIRVINKCYADFCNENYNELLNVPLVSVHGDTINYAFVNDTDVINMTRLHPNFNEIYKIMISAFKKKKRNAYNGLSEEMLKQFNNVVGKIMEVIKGANVIFEDEEVDSVYEGLGFQRSAALSSLQSSKKKFDRTKINIIVDNFQPLNNAHITAAQLIYDKDGIETVLVVIKQHLQIPLNTIENMIKRIIATGKYHIIDYVIVDNASKFENILAQLSSKYLVDKLTASDAQRDDFLLKIEYARKNNVMFNVSKTFSCFPYSSLSSPEVYNTIENKDYEGFKKRVPQELHIYFHDLRRCFESLI